MSPLFPQMKLKLACDNKKNDKLKITLWQSWLKLEKIKVMMALMGSNLEVE